MEYLSDTRARMPVPDRAKQFSAFDALSGLYAALDEKEKELPETCNERVSYSILIEDGMCRKETPEVKKNGF